MVNQENFGKGIKYFKTVCNEAAIFDGEAANNGKSKIPYNQLC